MGTPPKHIIIIAGEASGDMRAAGLARALKELDPSIKLSGIGGEYMRRAGVECFTDITELAVIGIAEVVKNFARIKKVFEDTLKKIDSTRPDAVVLVDYPGFNLRLAAEIKKRNLCHSRPRQKHSGVNSSGNPVKIIYYISPQVWAWREGRVATIKTLVDRMIVLFPFEKEIYQKYGMKVDYVGHPLVDEIIVQKNQAQVLKCIGLGPNKTTIGLMPGSRSKEVERHLPRMLEAAKILYANNNKRQFILLKASSIPMKLIESIISKTLDPRQKHSGVTSSSLLFPNATPSLSFPNASVGNPEHLPVKIYDGPVYDGINAMDAVMVASGTATLECALLKKPMVIIYKTSWLTYAIAKSVIKIPYIGLVNIVAGKKIAPELVQNNATAEKIAQNLEAVLQQPDLVDELTALKTSLGQPGASLRAAKIVLETVLT